jgi:glucan phosphoethanolaminetransferase (alkaline phosphatase superfamily)
VSSVSTLARPLFFAAWVCPTIALLLGDLPRERMGAALLSAVSSGALLAALPPRGFRTARSITLTLLPLSWLWVAYVTLNGSGPTAVDALTTLVNTNTAEASGALRLMVNPASIFIGLLQAILLIASYFGGAIRFGAASRAVLAATLAWIMIGAWAQVLLSGPIRVLPTSNDWQNFPYGSLAELIGAGFSHPELLRRHAQVDRRVPVEARVTQSIDSIFVVGETFRFDRDLSAVRKSSAWSAIQMRLDEGLGALLPKVCASADATAISVPMLLTGVSPQNADQAAGTPSGLARLDAAGYATAWISNQDDNWLADEHRNLVWLSKGFNGVYDDVVLPVMSAFLHRKDPRNKGLVVHLIDIRRPRSRVGSMRNRSRCCATSAPMSTRFGFWLRSARCSTSRKSRPSPSMSPIMARICWRITTDCIFTSALERQRRPPTFPPSYFGTPHSAAISTPRLDCSVISRRHRWRTPISTTSG